MPINLKVVVEVEDSEGQSYAFRINDSEQLGYMSLRTKHMVDELKSRVDEIKGDSGYLLKLIEILSCVSTLSNHVKNLNLCEEFGIEITKEESHVERES